MARAVRSVKKKAGAKTARRTRRVTVAKDKSRSRVRASAGTAAARSKTAEPAAAKPVKAAPAAAKAAKVEKPVKVEAQAPSTPAERRKAPAAERRKTAQSTRPAAAERPGRKSASSAPTPPEEAESDAAPALTDEEQIESAKYQPRRVPPRVFEEERFLFPQSYGVNRLRLLVKDPESLFAYWDVDPRSLEALRNELGSRAQALSQLTLRVFEDRTGGESTFLLPQDARTWYVPVRAPGRAYRAEVGVILPTGEFRALARSNAAVTPRVGRSAQKAKKRVRYDRGRPAMAAGAAPAGAGEDLAGAEDSWDVPLDAGADPEQDQRPSAPPRGGSAVERGGSAVKPGGSTVERGGASDLHRR
jgi:hypothetical protein